MPYKKRDGTDEAALSVSSYDIRHTTYDIRKRAFGAAGAAALGSFLGVLLGNPWLLAALNAAPPVALLFYFLRREEGGRAPERAAAALLAWAFALGAMMTLWTALFPERAEAAVWNGAAYRDQIFAWLRTGEGAEGDPARFLVQHVRRFALFVGLSAVSVGVLGLLMGVLLVDYMAFYAGSVVLAAHDKALAALLAWPPWALLRMAGFVLAGVCVAAISLEKLRGEPVPWAEHRRRLLWAAGLLAADAALKAALAPLWREWLTAALRLP